MIEAPKPPPVVEDDEPMPDRRGPSVVTNEKQLSVAELQAKTNLAALIGAGRPVKKKSTVVKPPPEPVEPVQ